MKVAVLYQLGRNTEYLYDTIPKNETPIILNVSTGYFNKFDLKSDYKFFR